MVGIPLDETPLGIVDDMLIAGNMDEVRARVLKQGRREDGREGMRERLDALEQRRWQAPLLARPGCPSPVSFLATSFVFLFLWQLQLLSPLAAQLLGLVAVFWVFSLISYRPSRDLLLLVVALVRSISFKCVFSIPFSESEFG
jgi:hypothetical protein